MAKDRQNILIRNELKTLEGKGMRNIWILVLILFLTFLGLGHSIGSLEHLKQRMDNPFTLWVNLPIGSGPDEYTNSENMQIHFESKSVRDSFFLDTIIGYKRDYYRVVSYLGMNVINVLARTINPNEPLLDEILKESNVVYAREDFNSFTQENQCWIIVKEELVQRLNFDNLGYEKWNLLEVRNSYTEELDFTHYIPIVAVVKDLPDLVDMVVPEHLNELIFSKSTETGFVNVSPTNKIECLSDVKLGLSDLKGKFNLNEIRVADIDQEELTINGQQLFYTEIYLDNTIEIMDKFEVLDSLQSYWPDNISPFNSYACNTSKTYSNSDAYYLAFNFRTLDRVRALRNKLKADYGFEVSLNQVEDKENFAMIAQLTLVLTLLLFGISMTSIVMFLVKLLLSHFDKIEVNLGTFKAFGLSNQELINDYLKIMGLFFTRSLIFSLFLTAIYSCIAYFLGIHFNLWHWSIPFSILIQIIVLRFLIIGSIGKRLKRSPGDLIYGR